MNYFSLLLRFFFFIEKLQNNLFSSKRLSKHRKSSRISKKKPLTKSIEDHTRPICYFEIEIAANHRKLGKLIFQLFVDVVPKTCENFLSFCRGFNGLSYQYVKKVGKTLREFHSLLKSFNFSKGNTFPSYCTRLLVSGR